MSDKKGFLFNFLGGRNNEDEQPIRVNGQENNPEIKEDDELLELGTDFDFGGYQVVRREFFSHIKEPSVTLKDGKFFVNSACLAKFPKADFVQVLINKETKIMALCPCDEEQKDSFQWCYYPENKKVRKPKQVSCKLFFAQLFSMMDWNSDYRYKLLGKIIHANGKYLIAFDLTATEVFQKREVDGKNVASRKPTFPAEWMGQFGLPYYEHKKSMQINIFDGYAIYAIKDNNATKVKEAGTKPPPSNLALPVVRPMNNQQFGGERL